MLFKSLQPHAALCTTVFLLVFCGAAGESVLFGAHLLWTDTLTLSTQLGTKGYFSGLLSLP